MGYRFTVGFLVVLVASLVPASCGRKDPPDSTISKEVLERVKARAANIRKWAPTCDKWRYPYPSKEKCGDGDMVAISGMLCYSGEALACRAVEESVEPNGRMWRAPSRVGVDTEDSYSRDQFLGLLLYIVTKNDKQMALRVLQYLKSNDYKLCPDATDNRCELTDTMWGMMGRVWRHLGIPRTDKMVEAMKSDTFLINVAASTTPMGYQLKLVAVEVLLVDVCNDRDSWTNGAAKIIAERDSFNPFFMYLYQGANDNVGELMLKQAPQVKPTHNDQFSIERDSAEAAWKRSMGWEFIFIANLLGRK